jgi:3-methyladenine DNA glycosylase/8-oxoguanine DNA glycosylase
VRVPEIVRDWRPGRPVGVVATLAALRRGSTDPAFRRPPDGSVWRTTWTPDGPATLRVSGRAGLGEITGTAWGPGAAWALEWLPAMLGADDDPEGFRPAHPVLATAWRRHAAWRVPRTGRVLESLVPAVLEQKVTGLEARRAWADLLRRHGEPAPGPAPAGMRVPPPAEGWRAIPSWDWHRAGVDGARSRTVLAAAAVAGRLEETVAMSAADATARLRTVPGVGGWTAAETAQRALGDADAVSVGDFHLAAFVGWALTGERTDDAGMLALLEPYREHRYRAVRLLELHVVRHPRRGPRTVPRDYRAM